MLGIHVRKMANKKDWDWDLQKLVSWVGNSGEAIEDASDN